MRPRSWNDVIKFEENVWLVILFYRNRRRKVFQLKKIKQYNTSIIDNKRIIERYLCSYCDRRSRFKTRACDSNLCSFLLIWSIYYKKQHTSVRFYLFDSNDYFFIIKDKYPNLYDTEDKWPEPFWHCLSRSNGQYISLSSTVTNWWIHLATGWTKES